MEVIDPTKGQNVPRSHGSQATAEPCPVILLRVPAGQFSTLLDPAGQYPPAGQGFLFPISNPISQRYPSSHVVQPFDSNVAP